MTPDEVRDKIRRRAGVRRQNIPVRVVTFSRTLAPRIVRTRIKGQRKKDQREVVVSTDWLQKNTPELWAAVVAARILGTPERLTITPFKEG